jgi:hypothetical protein
VSIYTTPGPIDLAINLQVGGIEVIASDRSDTVVTVSPRSTTKAEAQRGVEETKVNFDGRRVTVTGPRPRLSWIGPGPNDSVDVKVEVPTGSRLAAEIAVGNLRTEGGLGATRIKSSTGSVDVESTGDLWIRASHGNATIGTADGEVEITADMGRIRIGTVTGDAILKASHGSIHVEESGGDLDAKLSYGDLGITRALASVVAKTAYGTIRLLEVSSGSIQVESGYGEVAIGVRAGVPAWLDASSKNGQVRNELADDRGPEGSEQSVAIRARTGWGEIIIRHAGGPRAGKSK